MDNSRKLKRERERIRQKRKNEAYLSLENEANKERMAEKLNDPQYRSRHIEASRQGMTKKRNDSQYRIQEAESNRQRMTKKRNDSQYRKKEKEVDREFKAVNRQYINNDNANLILQFEEKKLSGPTERCSCCGCLWFLDKIHSLDTNDLKNKKTFLKYSTNQLDEFIKKIVSFENENRTQFCNTCYANILKAKVPRLALNNGLKFPEIPQCLMELNDLEERLVSARILFETIVSLPRGGQLQMKGNVVNVPVDPNKTLSLLPRNEDNLHIIRVELKRRLSDPNRKREEFNFFKSVRPESIISALNFLLKQSAYIKAGIAINEEWFRRFPNLVFQISQTQSAYEGSQPDPELEKDDEEEIEENFFGCLDTLLDFDDPQTAISYAPGEGTKPLNIVSDDKAAVLAFPKLFAGQIRPFMEKAQKFSPTDLAKSDIRRADRRCAINTAYLFFMFKRKQVHDAQNAVNIYKRKGKGATQKLWTAKDALNQENIDRAITSDKAFKSLKNLRTSPAYWETRRDDTIAMIRQLGMPTLFFTLSAAEAVWDELIVILSKVINNIELNLEEANKLTHQKKFELIRQDPVTTSRYFDHRFRLFWNLIIKTGVTFGNRRVKESYWRVEFQHRGSPHIHGLLWLTNSPRFDDLKSTTKDIENFIDEISTTSTPVYRKSGNDTNQEVDNEITNLVNTLQVHKHTKSCLKAKNQCRFDFPMPPMPETIILSPFNDKITTKEIDNHKINFKKIKEKLEEISLRNKGLNCLMGFKEFLASLNMNYEQYKMALKSSLKRPQTFIKREPNAININAYNPFWLKLWRANIDLQFCLHPYACVKYLCAYISKSMRGLSLLLKQANEEAKKGNKTIQEQVKHLANTLVNGTEISAQEAVYHTLSMPISMMSRAVIFINTGPSEERHQMLLHKNALKALPENSTDITFKGLLDHYSARPTKSQLINDLCLAEFASFYNFQKKLNSKKTNNNEECKQEDDDTPDSDEKDSDNEIKPELPQLIILDNNLGFMTKRTKRKVIRFKKYNRDIDPDNYYRSMLMLYYPWRDEATDLQRNECKTKFEANVDIILQNQNQFDPQKLDEFLFEALETEVSDEIVNNNFDPIAFGHEVIAIRSPTCDIYENNEDIDRNKPKSYSERISVPKLIEDTNYRNDMRSLNIQQRNFIMEISYRFKTGNLPFYYILMGSAGVGKSHTLKCVYQTILRFLNSIPGARQDSIKILVTAYTGKAAWNVEGITLHSALALPHQQLKGGILTKLSDDVANTMRVQLRDLKLFIIDEISLCSSKIFEWVNLRLQDIFCNSLPFGGISVLLLGDLHQTKPVAGIWPFQPPTNNEYSNLVGPYLWQLFTAYELTIVMRQKDDLNFVNCLNRMAKGKLNPKDKEMLKKRCNLNNKIKEDAVQLFYTNQDVISYNSTAVNNKPGALYSFISIDIIQGCRKKDDKINAEEKIDKYRFQDTAGLSKEIQFKVGLKYMITSNVDVADGLFNGAIGVLKRIDFESDKSSKIKRIWIEFQGNSGTELRRKCQRLFNKDISENWTPLEPIKKSFQIGGMLNINCVRYQFPLVCSESMTIHKSQGSTFQQVVVNLTRGMRRELLYTACSRVTSLQGLFFEGDTSIIDNLKPQKSDVVVFNEIWRLQTLAKLQLLIEPLSLHINRTTPVLTYINIKSMKDNATDLLKDPNFMNTDILILVETRCDKPVDKLAPFKDFNAISHAISKTETKTGGAMIFAKPHMKASPITTICKVSQERQKWHLEISIIQVSDIAIVAIYFSAHTPKDTIKEIFDSIHKITTQFKKLIVCGDFNITYESSKRMRQFYEKQFGWYSLLPEGTSTTIYRSQIDYIFSKNMNDTVHVYDFYGSDHLPFWMTVSEDLKPTQHQSSQRNQLKDFLQDFHLTPDCSNQLVIKKLTPNEIDSLTEKAQKNKSQKVSTKRESSVSPNKYFKKKIKLDKKDMDIVPSLDQEHDIRDVCQDILENMKDGLRFNNCIAIIQDAVQIYRQTYHNTLLLLRNRERITMSYASAEDYHRDIYGRAMINGLVPSQMRRRFRQIITKGDGNCWFRSISICLFGNQTYHAVIRFAALMTVAENLVYFDAMANMDMHRATLQEWIRGQGSLNSWAGEMIEFATAVAIQRPIRLYTIFNTELDLCGRQQDRNRTSLAVVHCRISDCTTAFNLYNNHYEALIPLTPNDIPIEAERGTGYGGLVYEEAMPGVVPLAQGPIYIDEF